MRGPILGILLPFALGCAPPSDERPDLVLISVDTLRADRLSCYGGRRDVGSQICALADGGSRFVWAFATAPYTPPSVASLLTSRYPAFHGMTQVVAGVLGRDAQTVARVLREAGYTTAAFVSNPVLDARRGFDQGFDVYDDEMTSRERNRRLFERLAEATTDAALRWARSGPAHPVFLWVHYQDPHGPYDPPNGSPARDRAGDRRLPLRKNKSGRGGIPRYQALPGLRTRAAYERRYLDEIRYLDIHAARLVAGLEALDWQPGVLLTADHGEAFGEDDYYFTHGHSVALDQIHVPLLWRPPTPGPSRTVETPVSLIDVAPTLLRLAGVAIPKSYQGRMLPLGGTLSDDATRPIFAENPSHLAVVVGQEYWSRPRQPGEGVYRPRRARLGADGAPPEYVFPEHPPQELESALTGFEAHGRPPAAAAPVELPPDLRERLRALGYEESGP